MNEDIVEIIPEKIKKFHAEIILSKKSTQSIIIGRIKLYSKRKFRGEYIIYELTFDRTNIEFFVAAVAILNSKGKKFYDPKVGKIFIKN